MMPSSRWIPPSAARERTETKIAAGAMLHYSLPPLLPPTNPAFACFPRHQATAAGAYAPDSSGAAEARHGREQGSNSPSCHARRQEIYGKSRDSQNHNMIWRSLKPPRHQNLRKTSSPAAARRRPPITTSLFYHPRPPAPPATGPTIPPFLSSTPPPSPPAPFPPSHLRFLSFSLSLSLRGG
jgi:hypothetical protein